MRRHSIKYYADCVTTTRRELRFPPGVLTSKYENPTSRDIAEIAGVSQATVSRALRDSPLVREETRKRVQEVARELNYFVNRNAAGLRTQLSNTLALLLFDETGGTDAEINPFFLSMLGNIMRSAASLGYDVLVSLQQLTDDWHVEYQASHRADGLILLGYGDYRDYRPKLRALADAQTRFIIWGPIIEDQPGHSFGCDNESGGFQATEHLLKLGRKKIAIVGETSTGSPELAARHDGYLRAIRGEGISEVPALHIAAGHSAEQGFAAAKKLIANGQPFDAVFAVTDLIAIGVMRGLQDAGLCVPDDVSVVGFDDSPLAAFVSPTLTTVRQNTELAAEGLVRGIVGLVKGEPVESRLMEPSLVIRQSCGGQQP